MQLTFELEGGNFSKAGYASSQIKKILKQLSIDSRVIKRVVVALYEAEVNVVAHAWRGKVAAEMDADKITLTFPAFRIFRKPCRKAFPRLRRLCVKWGLGQEWDCPI